jgi:hypothetical protein
MVAASALETSKHLLFVLSIITQKTELVLCVAGKSQNNLLIGYGHHPKKDR